MTNKKGSAQRKSAYAGKIAAATMVVPLTLSGPAFIHAAEPATLESWIQQQTGGAVSVGDTVMLDLSDYFGSVEGWEMILVNHNPLAADIDLADGMLTISGKSPGSTVVDLWIHPGGGVQGETRTERFRLAILWPQGLTGPQHLDVRDIINYLMANPDAVLRSEDRLRLMNHISSALEQDNRPPHAEEIPLQIVLPRGRSVTVNLQDVFYDSDGDELEYTVASQSQDVGTVLDGSLLHITGNVSTGEASADLIVVAHDGWAEASKRIEVKVTEHAPQALFDQLSLEIYDSMMDSFEMHVKNLFEDANGDDFVILGTGGTGDLDPDDHEEWNVGANWFYLNDSILRGFTSGGVTEATTVEISILAEDFSDQSLQSEELPIHVTAHPAHEMPVPVIAPGSIVNAAEWFGGHFGPYKVNGAVVELDIELADQSVSNWAEHGEDGELYVKEDAEPAQYQVRLNVTSKDGLIRFNSVFVKFEIGSFPD